MSNASDFIIENGVLKKYAGKEKEVTIPDGVTAIGTGVFRRKGVTRVTMPDTVTEIGWDAFSSCTSLENVTFSRNLKTISPNAFDNCQSLTAVILYDGLEKIGGCAFGACVNLRQLVLPEHPFEIDRYAFQNCDFLADDGGFVIVKGILSGYNSKNPEEMHIPEGVKYIIRGAARGQFYVHSLSMPASVEYIDDCAFQDIPYLKNCTLSFSVADPKEAQRLVKKVFDWKALAWAYLEDGLNACDLIVETVKKLIASKAGREELLDSLVDDENPDAMNRFLACVKKLPLEELDSAIEKAKHTAVRAALLEYKQKQYSAKKTAKAKQDAQDKELGLKEKTLSDWRKTLKIAKRGDRYAVTGFKTDAAEKAVWNKTAPDGVEITIPCQIGSIPVDLADRAFQNCSYVKTIVVEEGVTSIGDYAFSDCRWLRDVYIPGSVTDFGENEGGLFCAGMHGKPCTIHAPAGSKAEEQAKKNNIPFVAE